ncbi:MAG: 23S rRNA (uracil(1939)-C(5))-methyltransferase RlmD [Desulfobacteraceae bacterium]|nr:23S rRNA (uracil(1939)-C(5))-methyltransferase RlmD [Desulfobacteraceae bacterium]MCF8095881.1 23S rRNA (uracil(1939)-C(5))-methyltransferase RlmD [Desulfobacteraceae bacterium]
MPVKKKQEIELDITGIAFGGRGIARVDGFTVFVDQAVPGDRVAARILKKKKNYAEAKALSVINPSPDRIEPSCRYSEWCGGCKWQFLKYERQLEYKHSHVREALEHIGGLAGIKVHPVLPSEKIFGYRNKMEFSFSDRRWLLPGELGRYDIPRDFALGLHVPKTFDKILDIDACLLQPEKGNRILNEVRDFAKASALAPYGLRSHEGFWRFLMLRHSVAEDRWLVNVVTSEQNMEELKPLADGLISSHDDITGVVNNVTAKKAAVATGEYEVPLAGRSVLNERLGGFEFEVSANSFFQTNTRQAERLYDTVRQYAGLSGGETVVDLYTGTGTIPVWLSGDAEEIIGLELVEAAVADAEKNCKKNGIKNCSFIAGDIRESISGIKKRPAVMIIDPPRAGMHKDVVRAVLEMAPERMVYVSCNPATLARDLSMLSEKYYLDEIQPVDMFPHTYHIEAVARLEKR